MGLLNDLHNHISLCALYMSYSKLWTIYAVHLENMFPLHMLSMDNFATKNVYLQIEKVRTMEIMKDGMITFSMVLTQGCCFNS